MLSSMPPFWPWPGRADTAVDVVVAVGSGGCSDDDEAPGGDEDRDGAEGGELSEGGEEDCSAAPEWPNATCACGCGC
jgi:hypothetical protein